MTPYPTAVRKFRILETADGRFFPQEHGGFFGASWMFINEFSAKGEEPVRYTTYDEVIRPIELERFCYDKAEAERILLNAKQYFENMDKYRISVAVKQVHEY